MYNLNHNIEHGAVEQLAPNIRRITAPNEGPYTFKGTGTYIVGQGQVAIIDPGPLLQQHVDAIFEALKGETITHILVTHTHHDHSPACQLIQQRSNAPSFAFNTIPPTNNNFGLAEPASYDTQFSPDNIVSHGDVIEGSGWSVECLHTPGHMFNHLCFALLNTEHLFCGDQVMGWSSSIVSPPEGNLNDYLNSLNFLLSRNESVYWPTHGPAIENPKAFIKKLTSHREQRNQQILNAINNGSTNIAAILNEVYAHLSPELHLAATRSIFASIIYLIEKGKVRTSGAINVEGEFKPVSK